MKRRTVIFGALSTLALTQALRAASDAGEEVFEITRSDQEWLFEKAHADACANSKLTVNGELATVGLSD